MAGLGDIVQKAFYLGVGLASYAREKANVTLQELRVQAQKLADEMVAKGEMTTDEARKYVDDLIQQAQQEGVQPPQETTQTREPRQIEIISEDEEPQPKETDNLDALRQHVQSLQDELRNLRKE